MTAVMEQDVVEPQAARKGKGRAPKAASKPVDVPSASVETPEPATSSDSRYAPEEVSQEVAERVKAARDAGWSRTRLQELVEAEGGSMRGSALWRAEQGRVHAAEINYLVPVLDKIASGELTLPAKPIKDPSVLKGRVDAALALLEGHDQVKGVGNLRELLASVQDALAG